MAKAPEHTALSCLQVIDRLQVGPLRLEPRRLIAPYTITQGDAVETFELIYRYEEPVFEPDEESTSLPEMIAAQAALNYGLFCQEIMFCGACDAIDRKFLADMMDNTSREIFVNKLLAANPFIIGAAAELPALKLTRYTQARVLFTGDKRRRGRAAEPFTDDPRRCAVLSSGGKDSLLSYGMLQEMGRTPHSIFINESGRHWYTALNAFRSLSQADEHTTRVWTNADRLFNWMLRHLPMVRPDYARLRADIYPLRLWTVAVFLFGALPLMRKRRLGRLIIGDENDTTVRKKHKGITHYDGLYDQSRYFDEALSRYFQAKGYAVAQFSLLRPLSELLIEKTLCERYPHLQKLQVSCHSTHLHDGTALPCGHCEKCRRIVGMLTALGHNPQNCGYTKQQINRCLGEVHAKGIHQDPVDAAHVGHLLFNGGHIPEPRIGDLSVAASPPVTQLRFDKQRSPFSSIPRDLRKELWSILLAHADGAVVRQHDNCVKVDPLTREHLDEPYPFENRIMKETAHAQKNGFLLGQMTWQEAQERFKEVDLALLPVGATEQHGPHLTIDTDTFDADYLARQVAERCSIPRPLVLPAIPYGVSYHHEDFSGTLSITNETLARLVYELGMGCARNGVKKLVIINGHGGNAATLNFAAQMINRDAHIFTCVDSGETSDTDIDALIETSNDVHAGEIETSTTLAIRPELVKMGKARKSVPRFSSRYLNFSSKRSVDWYARTARISSSGVLGDPTKASAEKGRQIWDMMISNLVEFVEQLKDMSLAEIHQKEKF